MDMIIKTLDSKTVINHNALIQFTNYKVWEVMCLDCTHVLRLLFVNIATLKVDNKHDVSILIQAMNYKICTIYIKTIMYVHM